MSPSNATQYYHGPQLVYIASLEIRRILLAFSAFTGPAEPSNLRTGRIHPFFDSRKHGDGLLAFSAVDEQKEYSYTPCGGCAKIILWSTVQTSQDGFRAVIRVENSDIEINRICKSINDLIDEEFSRPLLKARGCGGLTDTAQRFGRPKNLHLAM